MAEAPSSALLPHLPQESLRAPLPPRTFTAMSELRTYLKNLDGSHKYVVEERDQTQKGACIVCDSISIRFKNGHN